MNLQSESIKEIANALAKAQAEMPIVKKDKQNPYFKSNYADLAAIWHAAKDVLSKHGLSVSQGSTLLEGRLCIVTTLLHVSGEWIRGIMPVYSKDENDPQKWGSGITYARRYSLAGILSMVAEDEDDDGNAAAKGSKPQPQKAPEQKQDPPRQTTADPDKKASPKQINFVKSLMKGMQVNEQDYAKYARSILNEKGFDVTADDLYTLADLKSQEASELIKYLQSPPEETTEVGPF